MRNINNDYETLKAEYKALKDLISPTKLNLDEIIELHQRKNRIEKKFSRSAIYLVIGFIILLFIIGTIYYFLFRDIALTNKIHVTNGIETQFFFVVSASVLVITALLALVLFYSNQLFYKELKEITSNGFQTVEGVINRNIQSYATIYIGHIEVLECLNNIFKDTLKSNSSEPEVIYFGAPGFSRIEDEDGKIEILNLEPWKEATLKKEIQDLNKQEEITNEELEKNIIKTKRRSFEVKLKNLKYLNELLEAYSGYQRNEKLRVTRYINLISKEELSKRSPQLINMYGTWLSKQSDRLGTNYTLITAKRAPSWFDSMSYFITEDQITLILGEGDLALSINGKHFSRTLRNGLEEYLERAFIKDNLPSKIKKDDLIKKNEEVISLQTAKPNK